MNAHVGRGRTADSRFVENLLATTSDKGEDVQFATAKHRHGAGLTDVVDGALKHRFGDVRRHALGAVTANDSAPLPIHVVAMAHDKGRAFGPRLSRSSKAKPDAAHQLTLIALAPNTLTLAEIYYGKDAS